MKIIKKIIPSIIVFIILGYIYYINNLYPFGTKPLVQVDADFQYIPMLYKIYDILHGNGNIFFSFIGLGNSLYGPLIVQGSLFSPLNIILMFIKRDNIVNFMGLFILIKICLIAFTSYFYIDKRYNVNYFYKVLFSLLYSFNGFILLNYFNDMWLDVVILFPIIIYYLEELLTKGKSTLYIFSLSLSLIISIYFSSFILIFIIFYSFIYLNVFLKKEDIKKSIFLLGKSTLIAFLISSFSIIPCLYQILNSGRFSSIGKTGIFSNIGLKSLHLLMSPLFIILFIKLIFKYKKNRKIIYAYFITFVLYLIPLLVDPINVQMHLGGFWSFPYRIGFITSFILMNGSLFYINNYEKNKKYKFNYLNIIYIVIILLLGTLGVYLNYLHLDEIIDEGILLGINGKFYLNIIYVILCVFIMYIISLFISNKITKYVMIGIISVYSIFLFSSWTIYYNKGYFLTSNAMEVYSNMEYIPKDGRYKVEYETYSPDFGFILGVDTLDNWLHVVPNGMVDFYGKLGYHVDGTTMHSYGGTIFSDYILNFKYVFSYDIKNDDMYTLISSYDDKYLYKYNYDNSMGILIDNASVIDSSNKFEYQNNIYKNLFKKDNNIIHYNTLEFAADDYYEYKFNTLSDSYVYFTTNNYDVIDHISINDNDIYGYGNYIKGLGMYSGNINIKLYLKEDVEYYIFDIGYINKDDILSLNSSVSIKNNSYYVNSDNSSSYLFMPINNIKGMNVFVNGKKAEVNDYLSNFVLIKLDKGDNFIKFKYDMPLYKISIILTSIGIVLYIMQKKIKYNNKILNVCYYLYYGLVVLLYFYCYFYSLFKFGI